jgi:hypothetical protein
VKVYVRVQETDVSLLSDLYNGGIEVEIIDVTPMPLMDVVLKKT